MERYEVLGAGSVKLRRSAVLCDFSISWLQFYQKYKDLLITIPTSLIDILKKAIKNKNWIEYNKRYFNTYNHFFQKLQIIALSRDPDLSDSSHIEKSNHKNSSFKDALGYLSAQKFQNFLDF